MASEAAKRLFEMRNEQKHGRTACRGCTYSIIKTRLVDGLCGVCSALKANRSRVNHNEKSKYRSRRLPGANKWLRAYR